MYKWTDLVIIVLLVISICFSVVAVSKTGFYEGPQGEQGIQGEQGEKGEKGNDGVNGLTPYIGADGNWWIGDQDTGHAAIVTIPQHPIKSFSSVYIQLNGEHWLVSVEVYEKDLYMLENYISAVESDALFFGNKSASETIILIRSFFKNTQIKISIYDMLQEQPIMTYSSL